jgi:hypothetical protein
LVGFGTAKSFWIWCWGLSSNGVAHIFCGWWLSSKLLDVVCWCLYVRRFLLFCSILVISWFFFRKRGYSSLAILMWFKHVCFAFPWVWLLWFWLVVVFVTWGMSGVGGSDGWQWWFENVVVLRLVRWGEFVVMMAVLGW